MICTATIKGALVEISGTVAECVKFFQDSLPPIAYGSSSISWIEEATAKFQDKIKEQMIGRGTRKFQESAVENIVRSMAPKKACDPMARHYGNCGGIDCPIIAPHESKQGYIERMRNRRG